MKPRQALAPAELLSAANGFRDTGQISGQKNVQCWQQADNAAHFRQGLELPVVLVRALLLGFMRVNCMFAKRKKQAN